MSYTQRINYLRAKMAAARGHINAAVQFFLNAGIIFAKAVKYALMVAREKRA